MTVYLVKSSFAYWALGRNCVHKVFSSFEKADKYVLQHRHELRDGEFIIESWEVE